MWIVQERIIHTEQYFSGGYGERYGGIFASPAIAEKGKLDTRIEVNTPGGHSSIPPEHTVFCLLFLIDVLNQSYI